MDRCIYIRTQVLMYGQDTSHSIGYRPLRGHYPVVAKASDGQQYPLPLSMCLVVCDGERGNVSEGADDVYI